MTLVPQMVFSATPATTQKKPESDNILLRQVDMAQQTVLDWIPDSMEETAVSIGTTIDSWRIKQGAKFASVRTKSEKSIAQKEKEVITAEAKGTDTSGPYVNQPVSNIQLIIFSALAFVFMSPLIFYLGSFVLLYIILKLIIRRLRKGRRGSYRRSASSSED